MMSFAGTITSLMSDSGLGESLETCYGKNVGAFFLRWF